MQNELNAFAAGLARLGLSEKGLAIALLWFLGEQGSANEATAADLAALLHDLSLRGRVNVSRLARQLSAERDVIPGKARGTFRVRLASKERLSERYSKLLAPRAPKVDARVLAPEQFARARPYMQRLVEQINGTFQFAFYDACAVLARRLMETLLIEAFEATGNGAIIRTADGYHQLSELIRLAASGHHIKLARGSHASMNDIKRVGDTAAHHRTYITTALDLNDEYRGGLRRVLSDLMHIAKLDRE